MGGSPRHLNRRGCSAASLTAAAPVSCFYSRSDGRDEQRNDDQEEGEGEGGVGILLALADLRGSVRVTPCMEPAADRAEFSPSERAKASAAPEATDGAKTGNVIRLNSYPLARPQALGG